MLGADGWSAWAQVREAGGAERVWRTADESEARHAQPVATAGPLTDLARFSLLPADDGARMVNIARNTAEGRMTIGMGVFERL